MDWQSKNKRFIREQEAFAASNPGSDKKLKRSYINARRREIVDYERWPADPALLRRIATHMERPVSPSSIERKLNRGEKVTTRHGAVYSLVPLNGHH